MKVSVKDLKKPLNIKITGDEPWLRDIHASFGPGDGDLRAPGVNESDRRIRGHLDLRMDSGGCVKVSGCLTYEPLVACSRCNLAIPVDVSQSVDALFKPMSDEPDDRREVTLSEGDLDERFIIDGQVDLEELLNDLIQTSIPTQTVQTVPGSSDCLFCDVDISTPRVFSTEGDESAAGAASPFAKLAGLKVKK
jgi:uncharacterized metal-binding protein YceD (DUF177 family)